MQSVSRSAACVGDIVDVVGHGVGDSPRSGEILQLIEGDGSTHYRIRWEDGRESLLYPGADIVVRRSTGRS